MEWPSYLVTLGAAGFGWLFSEASQVLKSRRQFRDATGQALVDVLLAWHDISAVEIILVSPDHQCALSKLNVSKVRAMADHLNERLGQSGFSAQLETAALSIASLDPLLAAEMRLRARSLRNLAADLFSSDQHATDAEIRRFFALINILKRKLQELAVSLARKHGFVTFLRTSYAMVRYVLRRPQLEELLEQFE